jgi:hypothetical protein
LATPIKAGPNLYVEGPGGVYLGKRAVLGWPFACVTWREEAEGPIGTPEQKRLQIVAVRVNAVAAALNLLGVVSVYGLVAALCSFLSRPRLSWQLLALGISSLVGLAVVGCLWERQFLEAIQMYADETG